MRNQKKPKRTTKQDKSLRDMVLSLERRIYELEQHALRQMPNPVPPIMPPVGTGSPPLPWTPNVSPPWITPFRPPSPNWPFGGDIWCSITPKP